MNTFLSAQDRLSTPQSPPSSTPILDFPNASHSKEAETETAFLKALELSLGLLGPLLTVAGFRPLSPKF